MAGGWAGWLADGQGRREILYTYSVYIPVFITMITVVSCSPLVTQMEKIMSPGSAINEPMLFNLGVFLRDTIAAVENLSIDDFIRRRKETGKLPFVDDS